MKTNQLLIALVLLVATLLTGCGSKPTQITADPEGAQAGDPAGSKGSTTGKDGHGPEKAALKSLLDQEVARQGVLGMIMAERLADGTVIWDTSGYTSPSGKERWTDHTASHIASITKTFTAVVVMQLVEAGKLSLDDTIDAWFPEQPNVERITVRMLLSHTSGLANYDFGMDQELWTRDWAPEELVAEANKSGPVREPGTFSAYYSNANYLLLGLIIEKVSGNSWEHEVDARIIKPLGLNDTSFIHEGMWEEGFLPGYMKTSEGYRSISELPWYPHSSTAWAAGGIVSSASDLMTFASALFDSKLMSSESLAMMTEPLGAEGDRAWALGGGVIQVPGGKAFAMGGDTPGYHAYFVGVLDTKLVVTALVNSDGDVITPSMAALEYISQQIESN